jgi:hypothetical protein
VDGEIIHSPTTSRYQEDVTGYGALSAAIENLDFKSKSGFPGFSALKRAQTRTKKITSENKIQGGA